MISRRCNRQKRTSPENRLKALWKNADAVCFDVDSTICRDEAIDELAKFVGREREVAEKTTKAMSNGMTFKESLSQRLELIQPSTTLLKEYLRNYRTNFTPGIKNLIHILHKKKVPVYLVSGGFYSLIEPVAKELNVSMNNVFANRLTFYYNGKYAGFDEKQAVCRHYGKGEVVAYLKDNFAYERLIMIGDGSTDLAACPPADGFIGFGGNQVRDIVKERADWFVTDFHELIQELEN